MSFACCLALAVLGQTPTLAAAPPLPPTEDPSHAGRAGAVVVRPPPLRALRRRMPTACTGSSSTKLPAAQCAAWIKFYDGTNGDSWKIYDGGTCTRHDPCGCKGYEALRYPVCNPDGTTVVNMCVRARPLSQSCCPFGLSRHSHVRGACTRIPRAAPPGTAGHSRPLDQLRTGQRLQRESLRPIEG